MMLHGLLAGVRYFAIVFAIAFVFGTARTLWLSPHVGDIAAVMIEMPFVLATSWLTCRRLVLRLPPGMAPRLAMGIAAFLLLMVAEFGLAVFAFGRSPAAYGAALLTIAGLIGLAGQIGFAILPLVVGRR